MRLVSLKAPFQPLQTAAEVQGGVTKAVNVRWLESIPFTANKPVVLDPIRRAQKGIYVAGYERNNVWITVFGADNIALVTDNFGRIRQYSLRPGYGDAGPGPVSFAQYDDYVVMAGTARLYRVNLASITLEPLILSPGLEGAQTPYLTTENGAPFPAKLVCFWNGRFVYAMRQRTQVPISLAPTSAQLEYGRADRLTGISEMVVYPSDLLFSDPFQPQSIKWSSIWTIGGQYGSAVENVYPLRQGLLVLTNAGVSVLAGETIEDAALVTVSRDIDCVAPQSVAGGPDFVLWLSRRGIAMFDGQTLRMVADFNKIKALYRRHGYSFTKYDVTKAVGTFVGGSSYVCFIGPAAVVYDVADGHLALWEMQAAAVANIARASVQEEEGFVIAGPKGGLSVVSDDGPSADATIEFAVPTVGHLRGIALDFYGAPTWAAISLQRGNDRLLKSNDTPPPESVTLLKLFPTDGLPTFESSRFASDDGDPAESVWRGEESVRIYRDIDGVTYPWSGPFILGVHYRGRGVGLLGVDLFLDGEG